MTPNSYEDMRRALTDDRRTTNGKFTEWAKLIITIGATLVSITLAYAALDKRIALLELKLDALATSVAMNRR